MSPPPGHPEKVAGEHFLPSGAKESVPVPGQALQLVRCSEFPNFQQATLELMFDNGRGALPIAADNSERRSGALHCTALTVADPAEHNLTRWSYGYSEEHQGPAAIWTDE